MMARLPMLRVVAAATLLFTACLVDFNQAFTTTISRRMPQQSLPAFQKPVVARRAPSSSPTFAYSRTRRYVSTEVDDQLVDQQHDGKETFLNNIPQSLRTSGSGIPSRKEKIQVLENQMYESNLIKTWDVDLSKQQGFDWEIEKMRRYFAGLRMRDDGTWVRQPSFFEFLVTKNRFASTRGTAPRPVGLVDVAKLTTANMLAALGFGPMLGMAAVPTAVIQKYEGSFFSFIKGVLGGDLQTLAGGPLFLLLAKYFEDYGPIFNLSFGPKSFLVISDPVMSRHVLKESSPEQYCKGMLAEILEPIMGKGLIPADPATWKVRRRAIVPSFHKKWLNRMIDLFTDRATILVDDLDPKAIRRASDRLGRTLLQCHSRYNWQGGL